MALCLEVRTFVHACEQIHAYLAVGGILTEEEKGVVETATRELLAVIRPLTGGPTT